MRLETAGDRFGRYQLIELIGQGGMAEVFRAIGPGAGRGGSGFVIKRIRPDRSDSPKFVQMFCDEARISALLHHPNIVRIYDFGQIDGAYFMAMEYLDGKDLDEVLHALRSHRAALPPSLAALVAREVARALEHAHTATLPGGEPGGIVHRDVSPSNIMVLRSGGVKILDFGIAKAAALARPADEGSGKHPKLQGHLGYLSPEQIRGTEVDRRSDLFSLGIVLWETLTGHHLFAGKDEFETMRNVLLRPVPAASRRQARIPAGLDAIVARALERDPAGRYQTAAEMAEDLDRFLAEMPCPEGAVSALFQQLFEDGLSAGPRVPPEVDAVVPEVGAAAPEVDAAAPEVDAAAPARPSGRRLVGVAVIAGTAALLAVVGWLAGGGVRAERDQSSSARSVSTSR